MNLTNAVPIESHKYTGEFTADYHYGGLAIHAGGGVHEYVFEHIEHHFSKQSRILVLGAGTGAFDKRLFDNGFTRVTSVDINDKNYSYDNSEIRFIAVDLNQAFHNLINDTFDVIVAIEIIEHLHSSANFLENCRALMLQQSALLITTPNPRSYLSRWRYLLKGNHAGFEGVPVLYEHINPVHIDIFRHHCHFKQLEIEQLASFDHRWSGQTLLKTLAGLVMKSALYCIDLVFNYSLITERGSILFIRVYLPKSDAA